MSGGGGGVGQADADSVDAAVGAGEDFEAEAVFFDDFSGEGDVAGDLGDETAEGGGFVVLGEAEGGGVVSCVPGGSVVARIVGVGMVRVAGANWSAKSARRRESSKEPETT